MVSVFKTDKICAFISIKSLNNKDVMDDLDTGQGVPEQDVGFEGKNWGLLDSFLPRHESL
jgi:hypothetical protein